MDPAQNAGQQSNAVTQGEQADVLHDVLEPVQEKDHPHQEGQVVVPGHHVLGAQVQEGGDGGAAVRRDERSVSLRDVMRAGGGRENEREDNKENGRNYHGADQHWSLEWLLSQSLS